MRNLAKAGIAFVSVVLACLIGVGGVVLFFAPIRLGLIPIPNTYSGTAARWALNLLPLAVMAAALIGATFLSRRFYRSLMKRFLSDQISN